MPSTITHAYIGLDVLKKLHNKPKDIINNHLDNFKVYCQSMDVLYFYHLFIPRKNLIQDLGHDFHNQDVNNYFLELINDNKKNHDKELFTFISGLITHYQADRLIHPYVNHMSYDDNKVKMIDKHFEIETYLDNYFINKNHSNNYQTYKNYSFIFDNYTYCKIIEKEIDKIFLKYFKFPKMGKYYYKSLKEMHFVYKHIRYDRLGIKKILYQTLDFNPFNVRRVKYLSYHFNLNNDDYYLNNQHNNWHNSYDKKIVSNKSLLELYDDVINNASNIINQLYQYIFEDKDVDIKSLIGNYSYSTGLSLD